MDRVSYNNRSLFSQSWGGYKSEIGVLVWLGSDNISLPGLQMATFLPGPHMAERKNKLSNVFFFKKLPDQVLNP